MLLFPDRMTNSWVSVGVAVGMFWLDVEGVFDVEGVASVAVASVGVAEDEDVAGGVSAAC